MNENNIKKANLKALPKFIISMIVILIASYWIGYFAAKYGIQNLSSSIKDAGIFFGNNIAPWLIVAIAILLPIVCSILYRKAKHLLKDWDGENEDIANEIELKLSHIMDY